MNKIKISENSIKEILYKHFNDDTKVNKEYFKLSKAVYEQTPHLDKNIAFFLTELCIKNLTHYTNELKYLPLWDEKYTKKFLEIFHVSKESIKNGLIIYENLSNLFINMVKNTKKMFFLTKEEYIIIHYMFDEKYDLNYYYACKKIYFNDYQLLDDKVLCVHDRHVLNIENKDIVILPEAFDVMNKLAILLNKEDKKIKLCNCNSFHTNEDVISVEDTNFFHTYQKIKFKNNIILEFNGNTLKYQLYMYIKYFL